MATGMSRTKIRKSVLVIGHGVGVESGPVSDQLEITCELWLSRTLTVAATVFRSSEDPLGSDAGPHSHFVDRRNGR